MVEKELNVTQNIQYQCLAIHMFTIDPLVGEKRKKKLGILHHFPSERPTWETF